MIKIVNNYPIPAIWTKDFWKVWQTINQRNYDVVTSHTRFFASSLLPFFASKRYKKWIHIEHGSAYVNVGNILVNWISVLYDNTAGRLIFKRCDELVVISIAGKEFVKKFTNRETKLIYRGLDFEYIDSIKSNLDTLKDHEIKLGSLGRLYKQKNFDLAIKAFADLNPPNCTYYIAGAGPEYTELNKLVSKNVVLLGELTHNQAIAFLKNIDIYLHCSGKGGGVGTALLEAMYCEKLVVCTPYEGTEDVMTSSRGIILQASTKSALQSGIESALAEFSTSNTKGAQAREYVQNEFTWEKCVAAYDKLFRSIA